MAYERLCCLWMTPNQKLHINTLLIPSNGLELHRPNNTEKSGLVKKTKNLVKITTKKATAKLG